MTSVSALVTAYRHPSTRPLLSSRRLPSTARIGRFFTGLALCALGIWLSVRVSLGLSPWDVLHAGLAARLGVPFGIVLIAVGLVVLAAGTLLGTRPGVGTILNIVLVGLTTDLLLGSTWLTRLAEAPMPVRISLTLLAVVLLGLGGALYISAGFGAGPRDSLMVACAQRGLPLALSRCGIELTVLAAGWLLGGPVGVGTLLLALGTGPAVSASFRLIGQQAPGKE